MFITLHIGLRPFSIQTDYIKAVFPAEVGSFVYIVGEEDGYQVDETAEEVMAKIDGVL